jgi:hypothetical protein
MKRGRHLTAPAPRTLVVSRPRACAAVVEPASLGQHHTFRLPVVDQMRWRAASSIVTIDPMWSGTDTNIPLPACLLLCWRSS